MKRELCFARRQHSVRVETRVSRPSLWSPTVSRVGFECSKGLIARGQAFALIPGQSVSLQLRTSGQARSIETYLGLVAPEHPFLELEVPHGAAQRMQRGRAVPKPLCPRQEPIVRRRGGAGRSLGAQAPRTVDERRVRVVRLDIPRVLGPAHDGGGRVWAQGSPLAALRARHLPSTKAHRLNAAAPPNPPHPSFSSIQKNVFGVWSIRSTMKKRVPRGVLT